MNGFEQHSINHSSASAINMWVDAPHSFVASYLFNRRSQFSPPAKVGVLAEEAVVNVLARGWTALDASRHAFGEYSKFTALGCSDADTKRGEGMEGMIEQALAALAPYGTPEFDMDAISGKLKQKKVELTCNGDGWVLPIIGYVDFLFPKHGVCVDLKTSMRLSTELSYAHKIQASIYQKALGNTRVYFLYCTPKKSSIIECPDVTDTLAEIKCILNRQERFLASGNADHLRQIVPVVKSSYYHDEVISKELFGI